MEIIIKKFIFGQLEEEYNIEIMDRDIEEIITLKAVIDFVISAIEKGE